MKWWPKQKYLWIFLVMNKASPDSHFAFLHFFSMGMVQDDAVKVLHSICQQIWKTQQWPQEWKRSVFVSIPKKGKTLILWCWRRLLRVPWTARRPNQSILKCGHCWVFHICWHIECSTFTTSSFRIWNSSTGVLSPPLALFVVMLPKAHLTSHSRMSGSRWIWK